MKKTILIAAVGLALFTIACGPREERQAEESPVKDTVVRIFPKDTPLPEGFSPEDLESAVSVASYNKRFSAVVYPEKELTVVYEWEWRGNIGRRKMFWTMENGIPEVWLANDGKHIVVQDWGKGMIPPDTGEDGVIFSFFKQGELIHHVTWNELIPDDSLILKGGSPYSWGSPLGLNASGHFVVETSDSRKIVFNVRSGALVVWEPQTPDHLPGWKAYQEIMRCYELFYPGDYRLQEVLDRSGRPTGLLRLSSNGKDWLIDIDEVIMSGLPLDVYDQDSMSFEQFAVERAKLMYSADGPEGSQWADAVERMRSFTNPNGIKAAEFSLTVVTERYIDDEKEPKTTRRTEGPLFAALISRADEPYRLLVFRQVDREKKGAPVEETLKNIVESVRILE